MTDWISVKERLPEVDKWVLLAEVPDSTASHVGQMDDQKRFWIWEAKDIWPSHPSHWLPLPPPPEVSP